MKTTRLLFTLLFIAAFSTVGFGQITGTAHDFSSDTWNTSGEICIVCHTPHNGTTVLNAPLWNHETTTATFTLYAGGSTMDATLSQPTGQSRLCLSCHDGTVALDSYGGTSGTSFIDAAGVGDPAITGLVGTDLSNDHPISFTYDGTLATADGELYDPTVATTSLGGTIAEDMLFGDQMQCASCHDVHGTGNSSLLRIANTGSLLCLTCHEK